MRQAYKCSSLLIRKRNPVQGGEPEWDPVTLLGSERPSQLEFDQKSQNTKTGCYTERELTRFSKDSLQVFGRVLMCIYMKRNYSRPGKEATGSINQNNIQNSHRCGNNSYSYQPEGKGLVIRGASSKVLKRKSHQQCC